MEIRYALAASSACSSKYFSVPLGNARMSAYRWWRQGFAGHNALQPFTSAALFGTRNVIRLGERSWFCANGASS
jgi:hypothetical protein